MLSLIAALAVTAHERKGAFTKGNKLLGLDMGVRSFSLNITASREWCVWSGFYASGRGSLGLGIYSGGNIPIPQYIDRIPVIVPACMRIILHNQFNMLDFYLGMSNGVNFVVCVNPALRRKVPGFIMEVTQFLDVHYGFDIFLGLRCAFTERFGMNFELAPLPWFGLSQPIFSAGIVFKLRGDEPY